MSFSRKALVTALAGMTFIAVSIFAENHTTFVGKQLSAERFTVVEHGGYFPVLIELDNHDLFAVVRGGDRHIGVKGRLDYVRSTDGGRTWTLKPWWTVPGTTAIPPWANSKTAPSW